ncbi:hypothetical protein LSTR_LSTR006296 [Laodelphax striatellus]|uniref:Uncharacterized protein n=1 Tax=Laodelphax striatellus TaxID=195883 RepID=A0A482X5I2_LAOST|nr:hypothetical protein LSTR_LSTR006296 [Laodelphax striatellus]
MANKEENPTEEEEEEEERDKRGSKAAGKIQKGRPPFKVWFSLAREAGRSSVSSSHPLGLVRGITGKFYSLRESSCQSEPDVDAVNRAYDSGPKQKFPGHHPPLESHRIGWYQDVKFHDVKTLKDRNFNFHRRTQEMFKIPVLTKKP